MSSTSAIAASRLSLDHFDPVSQKASFLPQLSMVEELDEKRCNVHIDAPI
jgi:hypothetical protein